MVGVPRSTGCQTCIQRRLKCDGLRPGCSHCRKHRVQCPGYARNRKFMDEGPQLKKRHAKSANLDTSKTTQTARQAYPPESIDERVLPSLVSKSMTRQQPAVFRDFVLTAFPHWFGLNKHRVHIAWTDYVAEVLGQSPALDAAIYCITSVFMGRANNDVKLQKSSREMYAKALVSFGKTIKNEELRVSRESLSTSILLSMFETYSPTSRNSWVQHTAGAALLMALRGAKAHLSGFDRCLYMSYRSFLISVAFIEGKPCIFDSPEWQSLIAEIRKQDMADPRANATISAIIDITDRIFLELVKIPSLVSQARAHLSESPPQISSLETKQLISRIWNCKELILGLSSEIRLAFAVQGYTHQNESDKISLIGPIPSTFRQTFLNTVLRGTDTCLRILDLLLHNLTVYHRDTYTLSVDTDPPSLPWSPASLGSDSTMIPFRIVPSLGGGNESGIVAPHEVEIKCPVDKWLDQVAISMGMEAIQIIIDDPVEGNINDPDSTAQLDSATILPLR